MRIDARSRPERRGAALLLVLIALAVGLLLVATWLDGRRESVPIARRVAAAAVARQAAAGGVDLALATIDAEDDWRAALDEGRFDAAFPLGSAVCGLQIRDADTGERPREETVTLRVTCTAEVDDVRASIERTIDVDRSAPAVDLGFGETAIMVERELRILDEAALLPWTARPGAAEGPLVVGSLDGRADAVMIGGGAVTLDTEVVVVDDRMVPGSSAGRRHLPDPLPGIVAPSVPTPDRDDAITSRMPIDLTAATESDVLAAGVRIPADAILVFDGDRVIRSTDDLELADGASVTVTRGTLVLDAADDLVVRAATISVADGASLVLRAGGRLRLHDAIVVPDAVAPADAAGERVPTEVGGNAIVATLAAGGDAITVEGRSAVVMTIVAPGGVVEVRDDAVLHGRILAADVELGDRAVVYALPDDGRVIGLTTPLGPHRDDEGALVEELTADDRGTASGLLAAAERIGMPIVLLGAVVEPDPESVTRRGEEIREKIRRTLEERRRRRGGPRWAWAHRERDD